MDQTLIKICTCRGMAVCVPVSERLCEKEWEGVCLHCDGYFSVFYVAHKRITSVIKIVSECQEVV